MYTLHNKQVLTLPVYARKTFTLFIEFLLYCGTFFSVDVCTLTHTHTHTHTLSLFECVTLLCLYGVIWKVEFTVAS